MFNRMSSEFVLLFYKKILTSYEGVFETGRVVFSYFFFFMIRVEGCILILFLIKDIQSFASS